MNVIIKFFFKRIVIDVITELRNDITEDRKRDINTKENGLKIDKLNMIAAENNNTIIIVFFSKNCTL